MKSVDERRKSISQAITRAYGVSVYPVEIPTDHAERDPREFIRKTAGSPHRDLTVADVGALALFRAGTTPGDEALASTVADLIDGGVSLDRQAAAVRGLDALMAKHRAARAKKAPLPSDLRKQARTNAPTVVKRGGGSAIKQVAPPPPAVRIATGARVRFRRLDDDSEHVIYVGRGPAVTAARVAPLGSPLAAALVGATVGTVASVILKGEPIEIEVLAVE